MNIDIKITYDDLSEETKQKLKDLEARGFKVTLTYPEVGSQKSHDDWHSYPWWTPQWSTPTPIPCTNSGSELPKPGIQVYCKTAEMKG